MVYLFLADGFEETEAIAPLDILRRAQIEVFTVGVGGGEISGAHGLTVRADILEDEILTEGLEMIVLPGGPGTPKLEQSDAVQRVIDFAAQKGIWIAAICAAPSILGHKGLLAGQNAVCYPGYEKELAGATVSSDSVCVSGKFVTANGPGASIAFGLKIVELLSGSRTAYEIGARMQVR